MQTQNFETFFAYNFLISNFFVFFSSVLKSELNSAFFEYLNSNFANEMFYVILALFWNFKAQFESNGSKYWKTYFIKVY